MQTKEAESEMTLPHLFTSLIIDGSNLGKLDLAVIADGDRQSKTGSKDSYAISITGRLMSGFGGGYFLIKFYKKQ